MRLFKVFLAMMLSFAVLASSVIMPENIYASQAQGPIVILKLDDLHTGNVDEFQRIADIVTADPELRASFGIIGDFTTTWGDSHSWKQASDKLYDTVALWHSQGIEIFHHGNEHARHYYDETETTFWTECNGADYAYQWDALNQTFSLVKEKMGFTIHSVGCPYSDNDEVFLKVLEEKFPEVTTIMFPDYADSLPDTITSLNNRVEIESATGQLVDASTFKTNIEEALNSNLEYCLLQGHAAEWDDTEIEIFKEYITYLKSINAVFMTPYEYTVYKKSGKAPDNVYANVNSSLLNNPVSGTFDLPTSVEGSDISVSWECLDDDDSIEITNNRATVKKYKNGGSYYTTLIANITDGDDVTSKEIPVRVVHHNAPEAPESGNTDLLLYEAFDSPSGVLETGDNYTSVIEDGKLVLTRSEELDGQKVNSLLRYYFNADKSGWDGNNLVVEYDVYTENEGTVSLCGNCSTNRVAEIRLNADGIGAYNGSGQEEIGSGFVRTNSSAPLNVKVLYNFGAKTFNVWVNDYRLATDFAFRQTGTYINNIYLYVTSYNANNIYIDNLKVYNASNDIFCKLDDSMSTYTSNEQYGSVSLPATLDGETAVTWSAKTDNVTISGNTAVFENSHYEKTTASITAAVELEGIEYIKDYTISLAQDTTPAPEVGENGEEIYKTNLDFSTFDTATITTKYSTASVSEGALVIDADTTGGVGGYAMLPLTSSMTFDGRSPVFEFDITRSSTASVHFQPTNRSATAGRFVGIQFKGSSILLESTDGANQTVKSDYSKVGTPSHIIIKMGQTADKTNAVCSLWVDGVMLAENVPTWKSTQGDGLNYLKIVIDKGAKTTLTLDNFKAYYAATVPSDEVDSAIAEIESAGLTSVVSSSDGDACLGFDYDAGGSTVTFSDTEGLVNDDGSINMPLLDAQTTLTVTVEKQDYAKSVTFDATIAGKLNVGSVTYSSQDVAAGSITSSITAYTRSDDLTSIEFITAYYAIDGTMLSIASDTLQLRKKDAEEGNSYAITAENVPEEAIKRKSFVLDSMTALTPLVKSEALTLPRYYHDDMVLQRGETNEIRGVATPNESVWVTFGNQEKTTTAGSNGTFSVFLDSMAADSAGKTLTIRTNSAIRTFNNVVVGDIWLVSGQSNAEFNMQWFADYYDDENFRSDIENAAHSDIRYMKVGYKELNNNTPGPVLSEYEMKLDVEWTEITPEVAADKLSALGYYFAKSLQPAAKVPVGIICAAKSGKTISQFLPASKSSSTQAAAVYNEMFAPLKGLKIKGVFWWQGEQDYSSNKMRTLMGDLTDTFREDFGNEELPFYYVQLQRYAKTLSGGTIKEYKCLREQMRRYEQDDPDAHMAVIIDLGSTDNIDQSHLPIGNIVGERLARLARYYTYGETNIVPSGPVLKDDEVTVSGKNMTLTFDHVGDGLEIRNSDELYGFELAGSDRVFYDATAEITSADQITVTSSEVDSPMYVRYIYEAFPEPVTLFNSEGLPASPFATDNPSYVAETASTTE